MSEFDPDAFLAEVKAENVQPPPQAMPETDPFAGSGLESEAFDPDKFLIDAKEEQYGSPTQQAIAGLEGAGRGLAGPLAPMAEKALGVPEEDIKARAEVNPITHGVGEAIGLGAGLLTGTGEAGVMLKAGELATQAAGLAEAGSYAARVGSAIVRGAAETAVMQGADETSKMVLHDPESSAQSAIANIGLAGVLGGATGAFITGAVSPLWGATVGPHLERFLGGTSKYLNGEAQVAAPEAVNLASKELGIELAPEMKAAMSGDPKAIELFNTLREAQHPEIVNGITKLESEVGESLGKAMKVTPEEIANYSEASGGKHAMDSFVREYKAKYQPIADEFDKLTEPFQNSLVTPRNISELADKVTSLAQEKGYLGADVPQDKLVQSVLNRLPNINTVQDLAKLNTVVDNISGQDLVLRNAGRDMKSLILNAQQDALGEAIQASGAVKNAPELFERYVNARRSYAELSKVSQQAADELGLGRFAGPKTLLTKLAEKRSPEQFLRRLSPKGNAEIINFLGTHFPDTLESIKSNELRQLLKPSVLRAKEGQAFNLKTLNKAIEQAMAGQPERLKLVLGEDSIKAIQNANTIMEAIPGIKSSGTAGWQQQMMKYVPQSALGLTAMLATHNPFMGVLGAVGGHVMKLTSRDVPDAIRMSMLKFLSSDQPIKAGGFKAMVDYLSHVVKGEAMINKATTNILKSSGMVLASSQMPSAKDNEKLNKIVEKYQKEPMTLMKMTQGQTGHYMPDHQTAAVQTMTQSLEYLSKLKPQPFKSSPLDKEIKPTPAQEARYNSALTIANQPLSVLDKAKDGTINSNDMQDIKAMYPAFYSKLVTKVTDSIANSQANDEPIPYKTRMGLSTFLGQPLDTTMRATSIIAAQPKPSAQPQQQMSKPKRGTATLGKSNKQYMTSSQAAEADRTRK